MKKKTLWWIIGIGVAILILLIIIGRLSSKQGIQVAVEAAEPHTITETVSASGKIYPETEVNIAPEVSGEIIALEVKEGDSVRKGQLLVRINPAIYNSMVSQQEASVLQTRAAAANSAEMVRQAESQFSLAQATYQRNQKLYQNKVISAMEFEQAQSQYESAKAQYEAAKATSSGGRYSVDGAQAALSQAKENLRKTTIFAPTSGIISQLNVKFGQRVVGTAQMAGTDMLTIADMSRLEVQVEVSETDIAKVHVGDTSIIEADAYRNRKFKGVVSRIDVSTGLTSTAAAQQSSDQVSNYTVRIYILPESYADLSASLPKGRFIFKPGMSASVEIQTRRISDALAVPVNAVTTRDWPDSVKKLHKENEDAPDVRQVVFVYDAKQHRVNLRDVTTGIQDNKYIQVLTGLQKGEQVVIAPYGAITRTLQDKSEVQVVKKEDLFVEKSDD